jgi:radical SAM protein with 4Fe4S-binding SPASM domain
VAYKKKLDVRCVIIEAIENCNNSCLHCYNYWLGDRKGSAASRRLTRAQIKKLIIKIKKDSNIEQVALSGGEPLLHEELPEICCDIAEQGLGSIVVTNGILLSDSLIKRFPEDTIFEVTLFSSASHMHDRMAGNNAFDRVIEGMALLDKHKKGFVVACVITKLNASEVFQTVELGLALGARAILFNRVNLCKRTLPLADKLVPSKAMLLTSLHSADRAAEKYGITVSISVPIPPCLAEPDDYPHLRFGWCPRGDNENAYYTIGADGFLRPCNHSSAVLGDLSTHDFIDIVESKETRDFWNAEPSECRDCEHPLRDKCNGGCIAAADECYGSRNRRDPFVDLVEKVSLTNCTIR